MRRASMTIAAACAAAIIFSVPTSAGAAPVPQGIGDLSAVGAGAVEVTEHPDGSVTKEYANGDRIELGPVESILVPRSAGAEYGVTAFGDVTTLAVKTRNWSATYTQGVFGEYFTHSGGQIKNTYSFEAGTCGTSQRTRLEVATSWGGYTTEGTTRGVNCSGSTQYWTSGSGNKRWWLEDPNQDDAYMTNKASGTISWNG